MNKEILKTVEAYLLTNKDFLSESETKKLEEQILHLKREIRREESNEYLDQLKAFRRHMTASFEVLMGDVCTDETVNAFYSSDFEITFRGKTVRLANGAEVFQGIEEIIWGEIDEF